MKNSLALLVLLPLSGFSMERYYHWIAERETCFIHENMRNNQSHDVVIPLSMNLEDLHEALCRKKRRDIVVKYFVLPAVGLLTATCAGVTYFNR